jgi:hypothetical protein
MSFHTHLLSPQEREKQRKTEELLHIERVYETWQLNVISILGYLSERKMRHFDNLFQSKFIQYA